MEAGKLKKSFRFARTLTLSIAALLILVNARSQSLPSVNRQKNAAKPAKNSKSDLQRLIDALIQTGSDKKISSTMAPVIGLEKPTDVKQKDVMVAQDEKSGDMRTCFVVFSDSDRKVPMCLFVKRSKQTLESSESKYFKVSLAGKLENAVTWAGKRTATNPIAGSGVKTQQDIESPEVKKEFNAEMAYWLKDWLKKESKKVPSKSASAASAGKTTAASL